MNSEQPDTQATSHPTPDELLPPVSPPSSGFVMQLFVIPLMVVSIIVGVWSLFHWVANRDMRPAELAQDIERLNHASWQRALTLANQLRDDRNSELRQDTELCDRLATQLDSRVAEGGKDQERVWLRIYLCRALGEFELDTGLPALSRAAQHQEADEDIEVRRAALQAIGILINRNGTGSDNAEVMSAVSAAATATSEDPELRLRYDRLRSTAAFVMGVLKGDDLKNQLSAMLEDSAEDVRFNAAVGLALHGDQRCVPILSKMLAGEITEESAESTMLTREEVKEWSSTKRQLVITTALRSVSKLLDTNPSFDVSPIQEAVTRLSKDEGLDTSIVKESERVLTQFDG